MFTLLEKFGLVCISIVGFQVCRFVIRAIYNNLIVLSINGVNLKDMGKWAVVTGATDGIGKAYAEVLAEKGINIALISRSKEKLDTVAQEITTKYSVETKVIPANFTNTTEIYHDIDKQLTGLEIGILINNVGMSYPYPDYFLDMKHGDQLYPDIINCNIYSVTHMCRLVMPGMVERRRGVVVNVSSTAAQIPSPLLSVYAASKSYVEKFTEGLEAEYHKFGLTVQCLLPGYVATNMSKIRHSTWMAPTAKHYVREALRTIGHKSHTTGYFPHSLLVGVVNGIDAISPRLSRWFMIRTMENIRARALRRAVIE